MYRGVSFYLSYVLKILRKILRGGCVWDILTLDKENNKEENPLLAKAGSHFPSENKEDCYAKY